MKKLLAAIAATVTLIIIGSVTFSMGVRDGIRHAIEESRVYLNGTIVELRLDGKVYVHKVQ